MSSKEGPAMANYRAMTIVGLAAHLSRTADDITRWKLVWEFLEEYRWESRELQPLLVSGDRYLSPIQVSDLRGPFQLAEVWRRSCR